MSALYVWAQRLWRAAQWPGMLVQVTNMPEMRAGDSDREIVVARLRDAHVDGRLTPNEFQDRLNAAYEAKTYGELERLTHDLPTKSPQPETKTAPAAKVQPMAAAAPVARSSRGDRAMRVMWTVWACAVSINLVIWILVSAGNTDLIYPWPIWVAGPWGAALASIELVRRTARQ